MNGWTVGEYDNLEELNEIAEELDNMDKYEREVMAALIGYGFEFEEAGRIVTNREYSLYENCANMTEVAERYCDECGVLDRVPEDLRIYFDFEAFGWNLDTSRQFIPTETGYCEIY